MYLAINELIQYDDGHIERILWVDDDNRIAYTIVIDTKSGLPILKKIFDILQDLKNGIASKITMDSTLSTISEDSLSEKSMKIRDTAWEIITQLVKAEPDIYQREKRGALIRSASAQYDVAIKTIYAHLRRYWQRGKNKNALLPEYYNCGGRGKEKTIGILKIGRPRKYPHIKGEGINVDENTKRFFRLGVNEFLLNQKENSVQKAFELTLRKYFQETITYEAGVPKTILIPEDQWPTVVQFRYLYDKEYNIKQKTIARKGKKNYEKDYRAILSTSLSEVYGPGSRYQIDATVINAYVVSRYKRDWIIGRPVAYAVIDVFSRMIVGLYVGLEGPSWLGAMMALANTAADKTAFCAEYGIQIRKEDWPCSHLPDVILGDRGELEGHPVETLSTSLNIRIENAAPYRADWKGIVERHFRTVQERVKPFLPGYVNPDFLQRGGSDYRLDAKLDIYQFTQILIRCALYHNNVHYLINYDRDEMMIEDDVELKPLDLWNWGISNRSGRLRWFPEDIVKLNLMPNDQATVTARGIKFKNMYYSCERAVKEFWFERARQNGGWKITFSYDPRNMNYIYLRYDGGRNFDKCRLLESQTRYMDKTFDEIINLLERERLKRFEQEDSEIKGRTWLDDSIEDIVNKAVAATEAERDPKASKASRVKGIKNNRKVEREMMRQQEAFELGDKDISHPTIAKIVPLSEEKTLEDIGDYVSDAELIRRKQREKKNGQTR